MLFHNRIIANLTVTNNATVGEDLTALGRTTLSDLGVTGNITAGLLSINGLDDSSCHPGSSVIPAFTLTKEGQAGIHGSPIGVGDDGEGECKAVATINALGDLYLQSKGIGGVEIMAGKVTIDTKGNITTKGSVTAEKYNVDESNDTSKSLGEVTIETGQRSAEVSTTALTGKSRIFVTPDEPVAIGSKATGPTNFRISLQTPADRDIKVNWWVVN